MSLLDDLKQQSKDAEKLVEELNLRRLRLSADISNALAHAHDLAIAIAALEPAPAESEMESVPKHVLEMLMADSAAYNRSRITDADRVWAREVAQSLPPVPIDYTEQDGTRSQQELEGLGDEPADQSDDGLGHALIGMGYGDDTDEEDAALAATDEPETHTDDLRTAEAETVAGDDRIETQSVTSDPDFVAAVERAEATLAAAGGGAYVGLQDAELDADWDAMKARQDRAADEKPKGFHLGSLFRTKEDA